MKLLTNNKVYPGSLAFRLGLPVAVFAAVILAPNPEGLTDQGVAAGDIDVYHVPGAWELPQAALRVAATKRHDAIIALGCVIRGETAHFDYVAGEAARGLGEVARGLDIPLLFGVLTTDTVEQAQARAGRTEGNKGRELAVSALGMLDLYTELDG